MIKPIVFWSRLLTPRLNTPIHEQGTAAAALLLERQRAAERPNVKHGRTSEAKMHQSQRMRTAEHRTQNPIGRRILQGQNWAENAALRQGAQPFGYPRPRHSITGCGGTPRGTTGKTEIWTQCSSTGNTPTTARKARMASLNGRCGTLHLRRRGRRTQADCLALGQLRALCLRCTRQVLAMGKYASTMTFTQTRFQDGVRQTTRTHTTRLTSWPR
jgi:hypothetical protein